MLILTKRIHSILVLALGAIAVVAAPDRATAQSDQGFQWSVIGAPGNRGTNIDEVGNPFSFELGRGGVNYTYRITQSKVSVSQYMDFVRAYAPFWHGDPGDMNLTGYWGQAHQNGDGTYNYLSRPDAANYGARITWEMSARYCNWLSNGKVNQAWAFETGAYDTSTFYYDGTYHHQTEHNPGAKYWIPSLDEWVKAVYYDPSRNGSGQGGYWKLPNSSDTPLVMGLPQNGGETIGDLLWQTDPSRGLGGWDLWQYPQVQSPWGLVDVSATVEDFTSTKLFTPGAVGMGGSLAGTAYYGYYDQLGFVTAGDLSVGFGGLRIASVVPGPPILAIGVCVLIRVRSRRDR